MKNLDMVSRRPLVELNTMMPTTMKLNCWDHIVTSILKPRFVDKITKVFRTKLQTYPVDENVKRLRDWVHLPHSVKDDVDSGDENLPDTVEREEISQKVEVHSLVRRV